MSDRPRTAVLHTVSASHWVDADDLVAAVSDRVPDLELAVARTPGETRSLAPEAEVVLASWLPSGFLESADRLRWVQALSAGVDFFDLGSLRDDGVHLTTAAGVHAEPIAEQTLGYMLAFERGILRGIRQGARSRWLRYEGGELRGKTVGVVGVGSVGGRVAELCAALGMTVVGTRRDPGTAPAAVDRIWGPDGLHDLLSRADYVVVACPLTARTRGLIGYEEFGVMSEEAVLVNVARGPIVDEESLVEALRQGRIAGAALDTFETEPLPADSPLWNLPNVIVTPHMAGSTPHKTRRLADVFETNYRAFRAGDPEGMVNRVT